MISITCKYCEHKTDFGDAKPNNDADYTCSKCYEPFNYFQKIEYINQLNKARVDKERKEANKRITRGLIK